MRARRSFPLLALSTLLMALSTNSSGTPHAATSRHQAWQITRTFTLPTEVRHMHSGPPAVAGATQAAGTSLPVAVDGAKTPELISDELAYRHFILAAADPERPSVEQAARVAILLSPLGLSETDQAGVSVALGAVREQFDALAQETARLSKEPEPPPSEAAALQLQKERILDSARTRFGESLSVEGRQRLDEHVRTHVKSRIVIYGSPQK